MEYKHYIRVDGNGFVTKIFCSANEQPQDEDVLYKESDTRQVDSDLNLLNQDRSYNYKYEDNKIIQATEEEKQTYLASLPKPQKTEIEILKEQLELTQTAMNELILGGM